MEQIQVGIVMGSDSDWPLVKKACDTLDGFGVVCGIFNLYGTKFYWYARRYGMMILIIVLYLGLTNSILNPALNAVLNLIIKIAFIGA